MFNGRLQTEKHWFKFCNFNSDVRDLRITDLNGGVSTFEQSNGQENAFLEDSVTGSVHDEVNNQIRSSFFVQVTLHFCEAHFSSAQAAWAP